MVVIMALIATIVFMLVVIVLTVAMVPARARPRLVQLDVAASERA
jgi:uncharacterized membrane protein YtjA (UPF0391 family)